MGKEFSTQALADDGDDSSNTSSGSTFSWTDLLRFSYPTQLSILNPSWHYLQQDHSLRQEIMILRPMFLSIYSISSEESLALDIDAVLLVKNKLLLYLPQ